MNGTFLSVGGAGCSALSNLFIRRNTQPNESSSGHLVLHYLVSFIHCLILLEDIWKIPINLPLLSIGAIVGVSNVLLMIFTMRALKCGPSGLLFSFHAASPVLPGLLLFLIFGPAFGFGFTWIQAIGLLLVFVGLYQASRAQAVPDTSSQQTVSRTWLQYAILCFVTQVIACTLIQWRCLIFVPERPDHPLIPTWVHEQNDVWFMPALFGAAFIFQLIVFLVEKARFRLSDLLYGTLSGTINALSTYLIAVSTKVALPEEQALLFPVFAVANIILCNAWAKAFYNEKFHLQGNALCSLGIVIGSIRV